MPGRLFPPARVLPVCGTSADGVHLGAQTGEPEGETASDESRRSCDQDPLSGPWWFFRSWG
ncbi:hypothetical protein GCM10027161_38360 [Microbispora hainanensis]